MQTLPLVIIQNMKAKSRVASFHFNYMISELTGNEKKLILFFPLLDITKCTLPLLSANTSLPMAPESMVADYMVADFTEADYTEADSMAADFTEVVNTEADYTEVDFMAVVMAPDLEVDYTAADFTEVDSMAEEFMVERTCTDKLDKVSIMYQINKS